MADLSFVQSAMDAVARPNWSNRCVDITFRAMPWLALFLAKYGDKENQFGIGVPDSGLLVSGIPGLDVFKPEIFSSTIWTYPFKHKMKSEADGKTMPPGSTTPQINNLVTTGPETRFKRPGFKWFTASDPCAVDEFRVNQTQRAAAGETLGLPPVEAAKKQLTAVGNLMDIENKDAMGIHLKRIDDMFHGTYTPTDGRFSNTGLPSDYTAETLDSLDSFAQIASATSVYAGVDRNVAGNELLKGNTISDQTAFSPREMIRYAENELYGDNTGLVSLGGKLDVILCNGTQYSMAQAEAAASSQGLVSLSPNEIAERGYYGFKRRQVCCDETFVIQDPSIKAGTAVGLNLETFFMALHPDGNFKVKTPTYLGDRPASLAAFYWYIYTQMMAGCVSPKTGIVYWSAIV